MQIVAYLLARFSEPSSYAGLGALLALLGWHLADTAVGQLAQLLAAACGLLALFLRERGLVRAIVLVFAVLPAVSACSGMPAMALGSLGSVGATYGAIERLASAAGPYIAKACGEYASAKLLADGVAGSGILPAAITAKLAAIESFGDAACAKSPDGDPQSTSIWLGELAGQIAALTSAEK